MHVDLIIQCACNCKLQWNLCVMNTLGLISYIDKCLDYQLRCSDFQVSLYHLGIHITKCVDYAGVMINRLQVTFL